MMWSFLVFWDMEKRERVGGTTNHKHPDQVSVS